MAEQNTVETPDFTGVVSQQFFIEPQGGPQHPVSYLDAFPNTIYNKSINSNLVALMYALLGPAGLGGLRKDYLLARLSIEDAGLHTVDLDAFYANPLGFTRLASETYLTDTEGLLTNAQWEQIQTADASYRNRAIDYLNALRAGGTLQGLTLAAKSGLNHSVELVENYRALYDKYSDDPLGLEIIGLTKSTEEVIVLPRQELPQSSLQRIMLEEATKGTFALALPLGTGIEEGEVNHTIAEELPFNITAFELQLALEAVYVIGKDNVTVSGGPLNTNPIEISFTKNLADTPLPEFLVLKSTIINEEEELLIPTIEVDRVGVSADGEMASIPPENWYFAQVAIDRLKPMTTIVTPGKAPGITKRQVASNIFSDSEFIEVLRYVTGKREVPWPERDAIHWIVPGVEYESPVAQHAQKGNYLNFHNISNVTAYTELALKDSHYMEPSWPQFQYLYVNEHIGEWAPYQTTLFPVLKIYANQTLKANYSTALPSEVLTVQEVVGGENLINGIYPIDYSTLAGVEKIPSAPTIWGSTERATGSDYLEIDLGTVQAVNFMTFEINNVPYNFYFAYDVLDESPARRFVSATILNDQEEMLTKISSVYNASASNPWTTITLKLANSLGGQIFTRFIRIEMTRRTGIGSPFTLANGENLPYSIEVQHLRVGRNV
jgi:hypothetical protein